MPNEQSPIDKAGSNIGKWILGTISTITAIVSFVNLMRGNFQLGILIFTVLLAVNLFLGLLYVIFYTKPASGRSKKRIYPYEKYRKAAMAGIVILLVAVSGALSMKSNREFIGVAVMGTPTATAAPTSTPLPPETTMLVTIKEDYPCSVDAMGGFDVTRKDVLDVGINNNSDRDLLITSLTLKPLWITGSQWMGPTSISATYDVSLEDWWQEAYASQGAAEAPTAGWWSWVQPDPIKVEEITGDKFTIKRNSQDRFELVLGLADTFEFLWGALIVEVRMDNDQTLTSDPIEFAVCYEHGGGSIPDEPVTATLNPEVNREGLTWFAWNNLASQESSGVMVEIARIVLAEKPAGLDFLWDSYEEATAVEIFLKVQNDTEKRRLFLPRQLEITLNPPVDYQYNLTLRGVGQDLNGYLEPGETRFGSVRFTTFDFAPSDIESLHWNLGCAFNEIDGCAGPFEFDIDLSNPAKDPLPEAIKDLVSP